MPVWISSSINLSNLSPRWTGILLGRCFLNVASFLLGIWNLCFNFPYHICDEKIDPDPQSKSELRLHDMLLCVKSKSDKNLEVVSVFLLAFTIVLKKFNFTLFQKIVSLYCCLKQINFSGSIDDELQKYQLF